MANEVAQKFDGTISSPFLFKSSSYSPTSWRDIQPTGVTPTTVDFSLGTTFGLADGGGYHSDQFDFGANPARLWSLQVALEWFAAVTAGELVDFYMAYSSNSTAAEGWDGGDAIDGVDGDLSISNQTVAEAVAQMQYIGSHVNNGYQGVQIQTVGLVRPLKRYGCLVCVNNSGTAICGTDDVESAALLTPLIDEIQ